MNKRIKKSINLILSLLMIFSLTLSSYKNVYATNSSSKDDYPLQGTVKYNGKVTYQGTIVGDFTINGMQAFCMEHPKATPPTGTKISIDIYDDNNIRKVLYYGWGGHDQWSGFKSREHGIVVTSLALSYFYYGDNSDPSLLKPYLDFIKAKTVSNFSVNFSKSNVQAYKEGNIQRTEIVELESENDLFGVTVSIPAEVTYVDETHGTSQKGGSVTIKGQTKFHLEAPLNVKLDLWSTGAQTSYYDFMPIISVTTGSYQNLGSFDWAHDPGQTTSLEVEWLKLGSLEITKNDVYGNLVDGSVFRLWNNNGYDENITVVGGKIKLDSLVADVYYLQEQSAPSGFLLDNTIYTVTLNVADDIKQTVTNKEPKGKIEVIKTNDINNRINGAVIDIFADGDIRSAKGTLLYANGTLMDTVTTSNNGTATTKELPLGNYKAVEKSAPNGYLLNRSEYKVSLRYSNQNTPLIMGSTTIVNKEPLGVVEFQKEVNSDVTGNLLGDVFLSQIKYGLYAKNDIYNVARTKKHYSKDQLIISKYTDNKGYIKWDNLPMGDYYLKELETNNSLLINDNIVNVSLTYQNMNTSIVSKKVTQKDLIASQRIQIFKEGIKDGQAGVVHGLKGAEFTFVLNSEYEKVGFENAKKYYVGETDVNGFLTSGLMPYGKYRVRETKTPNGYYGASDFIVDIEKDNSLFEIGYKIKKVTVNNVPFESLIRIKKKDSETDKTVLRKGAKFKVKNLDKDEYVSYIDWSHFPSIFVDTWTTHEDGTITLNKTLPVGNYELEEMASPDNYILNTTPLKFRIDKIDDYEIAEDGVTPIITVDFKDESVKGEINVLKEGEVLTSYDEEKKQFIYEKRALADMVVNVYAKEDIVDPCNDGTVIYHQGELVDTMMTDESGKAKSKKLPLGKYEVEEKQAPQYFVTNDERKEVNLEYENENVELVSDIAYFYNERQKVKVETSKQDSETLEYVEGAEITLKANRDIFNFDGEVIVKEGTILETVKTDEKGKVIFDIDLPNDMCPEYAVMPITDEFEDIDNEFSNTVIDGVKMIGDTNSLFVVYESKEPNGYVPFKVNYYIDTKYTKQDEKTLNFETPFMNDQTVTEFNKTTSNGIALKGNEMCVIDFETNEMIDTWISNDKAHVVKKLILGRKYIYRELKAVDGYKTADDIVFIAKPYQELTMVNNPFVSISKLDSINKKYIPNTHLQVINKETKEVVKDMITVDGKTVLELLEGTTYILHEVKEVNGYYLNENDVEFVATPNLNVEFFNMPILTQIKVNKIDSVSKELITFNHAKINVYADKDCKVLIESLETTNEGFLLTKSLRYQTVYIKEEQAPNGYMKTNEVYEVVIDEHLKNVGDIYELNIENTKIPIIVPEPNTPITSDTLDEKGMIMLIGLLLTSTLGMICYIYYVKKRKGK